jgi:predicted transcriptional regulator
MPASIPPEARIEFKLPSDLKKRFMEICAAKDQNAAQVMRRLIADFIELNPRRLL